MVKLAPHQNPWIAQLFSEMTDNNAFAVAVAVRLSERNLSECIIGLDGDHGYWREEHIYRQNDGEWMFSVDSHRGFSNPTWKLPTEAVEDFIKIIVSKLVSDRKSESKIVWLKERPCSPPSCIVWYKHSSGNAVILCTCGEDLIGAYNCLKVLRF